MNIRKNKRFRALLLATIFSITYLLTYVAYIQPLTALAATTGTLTGTSVNVRTSPEIADNAITQLNTGDQVTILDTVYTGSAYAWYHIGFNYKGVYTEGYITSQFVSKNIEYSQDADFEAYLNTQGFPDSYKDGLRQLHAQYPKWVFTADHISYDWNKVVDEESKTGHSLIYNSAVSSWKSTSTDAFNWENGTWYEFDSGGWVAASRELVSYALDPRNFLNATNIFMFEKLSYNPSLQSESGVSSIISGTFMQNTSNVGDGTPLSYGGTNYTYPQALMKAGQDSGVSPYHLASRIIQEIGSSGASNSISGTVSGYEGYYNYFNQGAYKSGDVSAIIKGLQYAQATDSSTLRPWNSRMKSIIGGAKAIGASYINKGQDTIYYEKFDLVSGFWHQYMTNILAPRSESSTAAKAYNDSIKAETGLVFAIPVYQNMPDTVCSAPTKDGNPDNYLSSLSVSNANLTPSFSYKTSNYDVIVENNISSIDVSAEAMVSSASISGVQTFGLNVGNNTINVVVTAENGDTKTYTINVVRKEAPNLDGFNPNSYTVNTTNKTISGANVGSSASDVLNGITLSNSYSAKILHADGSVNNDKIATGDNLVVSDGNGNVAYNFSYVLYGDVTGDGLIDIYDLLNIKRHILGTKTLTGAYYIAAHANRGSEELSVYDILSIKRHILGYLSIKQD